MNARDRKAFEKKCKQYAVIPVSFCKAFAEWGMARARREMKREIEAQAYCKCRCCDLCAYQSKWCEDKRFKLRLRGN